MRLNALGEAGLIRMLAKNFKPGNPARRSRTRKQLDAEGNIVKGIGDDCAVIRISKNKFLLVTIDMLIEDVDFRLKDAAPYQIGWKSLACGLSDIAAMGGVARYAVISLGLPRGLSVEFIDGLYRGIKALAKKFGVEIIGGDTNSAKALVVDVAVLGFTEPDRLTLRSGARHGDIICVTGSLGGSYKSKRHLTFTPRLKEARCLVNNLKVSSMIDISDGLSTDLNHIAKESGLGACVYEELIPVSKDAKGIDSALNEGEDFELLFTIPLSDARRFTGKDLCANDVKVTPIGEMLDRRSGVKIIGRDGRARGLKPKGFSHF
jgi:thiamine-monophosphate kinase